jgi:hypothetical protein
MTFTRSDDATVRRMLTELRDADWSWRDEEVDDLVTRLGWQVTERYGRSLSVVLPWALPDPTAMMASWSDGMSQVDFDLTGRSERTPETAAAADDAFADFAAIATEVLGPPAETVPGRSPVVGWRTAGSTFRMTIFLGEVGLNWSSNAYQQFLKDTTVTDLGSLEDDE